MSFIFPERKRVFAQFQSLFERSHPNASGKILKNSKKVCVKQFFSKIAGSHPATSLRSNFFTDNFLRFSLNEQLSMAIMHLWKSFLLLTEILQLVYEISSLTEIFYKKVSVKNFSKFKGKHQCRSFLLIKLNAWQSEDLQHY